MTNRLAKLLLALALAGFAALSFSGCESQDFFTKAPPTQVVLASDSVQLPDGSYVSIAGLDDATRARIPHSAIIPAQTTVIVDDGSYAVRPEVQASLQVARAIPIPYADVIAGVASSVLGIATFWLNRKKRASDKIAQSVVSGIDDFRDLLDQTPGGRTIDGHLTQALKSRQEELGVAAAVAALLARYQSPVKPAGSSVSTELIAELRAAGLLPAADR